MRNFKKVTQNFSFPLKSASGLKEKPRSMAAGFASDIRTGSERALIVIDALDAGPGIDGRRLAARQVFERKLLLAATH